MDGVLGQNVARKWVWIPLEDCFCHLRNNTNRVGNFPVEKSSSYNYSVDGSGHSSIRSYSHKSWRPVATKAQVGGSMGKSESKY